VGYTHPAGHLGALHLLASHFADACSSLRAFQLRL
jgi:hypothetical protein